MPAFAPNPRYIGYSLKFFKRIFSRDYRAAVAAEAAGDYVMAAEHYGLIVLSDDAARMHMEIAKRAKSHEDRIEAYRDAMHWSAADSTITKQASEGLGIAIIERLESQGIATNTDFKQMREAAEFLCQANTPEAWIKAGQAWEKTGDKDEAIHAYSQGGAIDDVERLLNADAEAEEWERQKHNAFQKYEMHKRVGERDAALLSLKKCLAVANSKGEYRRILDELESKILTSGRVHLRVQQKRTLAILARQRVTLGRDPLSDLPLRSGGISRRHAEITLSKDGFSLVDLRSKNGTSLGGIRIANKVSLSQKGTFTLAGRCRLHFSANSTQLSLNVEKGVDQGTHALIVKSEQEIDLTPWNINATIYFERGRPYFASSLTVELNNEIIKAGKIQLIRGDLLAIEGQEIFVE